MKTDQDNEANKVPYTVILPQRVAPTLWRDPLGLGQRLPKRKEEQSDPESLERRWELRLRPLQRTERSDAGVKGHPRVRGLGRR